MAGMYVSDDSVWDTNPMESGLGHVRQRGAEPPARYALGQPLAAGAVSVSVSFTRVRAGTLASA